MLFTPKCTPAIAVSHGTRLSYVKVAPLILLKMCMHVGDVDVSISVSSSTLAWHFEEITTTTANMMLLKHYLFWIICDVSMSTPQGVNELQAGMPTLGYTWPGQAASPRHAGGFIPCDHHHVMADH